jgi:hypothetical protein
MQPVVETEDHSINEEMDPVEMVSVEMDPVEMDPVELVPAEIDLEETTTR